MEKIAASLPPNTFGIRDLSLLTLDSAIAGREHELTHLRVRGITEDARVVGSSWTFGCPRGVPGGQVPFGTRAHLCPVKA
ncbi:hypothetical protein [Streptomyces sp. NPDC003487]